MQGDIFMEILTLESHTFLVSGLGELCVCDAEYHTVSTQCLGEHQSPGPKK